MTSIGFNPSFRSITALNANQRAAMNTLEKLASGSSINRGADDPSGLIASENFASRISTIQGRISSLDRSVSVLGVRDGAMGATLDNVSDLDALVVRAAGASDAELGAIQTQVGGALSGIRRTASLAGLDIAHDITTRMVVGADESTGDPIYETVSLSDLSRVIETDAEAARRLVDGARQAVLEARAQGGADARAQESERRVLEEERINTARAYSRTRDADYARESSSLIRSRILGRASIAAVLADRINASAVLSLLDVSA